MKYHHNKQKVKAKKSTKKILSFFDDKSKGELRWFNRNYFFLGTIFVVALNILLFGVWGSNWPDRLINVSDYPFHSNCYTFPFLMRAILGGFSHGNWQHVLLNMLCFLITGMYLERKKGTLRLFLLIISMAFVTLAVCVAEFQVIGTCGFSYINFGIYGFILVDYLFMFKKETRTRFNIISGAIIIMLIYLAMCFNGGSDSFGFSWYPYDLITNLGHFSGFFAGIVLGFIIQISQLLILKQCVSKKPTKKPKLSETNPIVKSEQSLVKPARQEQVENMLDKEQKKSKD